MSPLFYKAFVDYFTSKGKNIAPDKVNGILDTLGIEKISKSECCEAYNSLVSLYNIRNSIAHGNDVNFNETLENILDYIVKSKEFFIILDGKLDAVKKSKDI